MNQPTGPTVPEIGSAIEQVLQRMYFCDAMYGGPASLKRPTVGAAVRFSGSIGGEFRVAISEELALRVATDFLALDVAASAEQVDATLKEFANIACGAAMSAWLPAADLHFSTPRAITGELDGQPFSHCFTVAGEQAEIGIEIAIEA